MNITKRPIFHAIIHFLLPSEAAIVLQCRKVFVVQVEQAAEAEIDRHIQALELSQAAFSSPSSSSNVRYLHYLQQRVLTEALAGWPVLGFRFAVTKSADEQAPPGLDKQILDAAEGGKIDELLGFCREWTGHPVVDTFSNEVSQDTNTNKKHDHLLARLLTKQTNKRIVFVSLLRVAWLECLDRCC